MAPNTVPLCLVAFLPLWLACGCSKTQAEAPTEAQAPVQPTTMTIDLQETAVEDIKLLGDRVAVALPGGGRADTLVTLSRTKYEVSARTGDLAYSPKRANVLYCYELRSVEPGVPLIWSIWTPSPVEGSFQVLVNEKDEKSYLVVIWRDLVKFVTIERPKSRTESLLAYVGARTFSALAPVIVTRVLGEEPFFTGTSSRPANAANPYEVHVLDISRDTSASITNGDWIVTVAGVDKTKTFRLRFGVLTGQWSAD